LISRTIIMQSLVPSHFAEPQDRAGHRQLSHSNPSSSSRQGAPR
jgi:hypothetical protein